MTIKQSNIMSIMGLLILGFFVSWWAALGVLLCCAGTFTEVKLEIMKNEP